MAEEVTQGPTSLSVEDYDKLQEAPAGVEPSELKLDGDSVPESLRGKSLADVLEMNERLANALRTSEENRTQLQALTKSISEREPTPEAPKEPAAKVWTRDELNELYQEDPLKAIEIMQSQGAQQYIEQLERRLGPIAAGAASSIESQVRAKYGREFEVLGDEIAAAVKKVGGAKVMTTPEAWEDIISYVRGRPGNFEKLTNGNTPAAARQQEIQSAGFSGKPEMRTPVQKPVGQLDPIQKQIADELGMSEAEYLKWSKV